MQDQHNSLPVAFEAKEIAHRALARIEKHEAVCDQIEKSHEQFRDDMREWLKRIQEAYETGVIGLRVNAASSVDALRLEFTESCKAQKVVNKDIYNRLWIALIAWAVLMTSIAGTLAVKLFFK